MLKNDILKNGTSRIGLYESAPGQISYQMTVLYKLFSEFGIGGRMWLVIKDLYTGVRARVLYSGSLSREFDVLQGAGQGRILAPFMYKVYINGLLNVLTNHCYSISVNRLSLPSPSFADALSTVSHFPPHFHGDVLRI